MNKVNAHIAHTSWVGKTMPKKILAMRFQALGDLMITLPYLASLKQQLPASSLHLLTRKEFCEIPKHLKLFDHVITIGGGRNAKTQFLLCLFKMPWLWWQRYDVVIDLQNHRISKIIRRLLRARAWSEFDRSSRILAGDRTRLAIDAPQIARTCIETRHEFKSRLNTEEKLRANGWQSEKKLIVLNPAGAFITRNWPTENYIAFAKLWLEQQPASQIIILGLPMLKSKATIIKNVLGKNMIDLTGQTSLAEAFLIIRLASLIISEDSGLMHMAWIQGVPTVALFGSSPSYWSSPMGEWSRCLNSSDLLCGDCFQQRCKFGDVHCLTRLSPEKVFHEANDLLRSLQIHSA
jgi:ADP-heptose:LPS heptosyltransferase